MKWKCYIVSCSDGSIYTGVTTDVARRIYEHNFSKKGSKYCKSRRPIKLIDFIDGLTKSQALKLECYIKHFRKGKVNEFLKRKKEMENGRKC